MSRHDGREAPTQLNGKLLDARASISLPNAKAAPERGPGVAGFHEPASDEINEAVVACVVGSLLNVVSDSETSAVGIH
jgi:hypothetical protein